MPSFADKPEKNTAKPALAVPPKDTRKKREEFAYEKLAESLLGFAVVVYVQEKCLPLLRNKCSITLSPGDIAVYSRGKETDHHSYAEWTAESEKFFRKFRAACRTSPKRGAYHFGHVMFLSEARLQELRERRHVTRKQDEKMEIYRQEKEELKRQVQELSQQNIDLRLNGEQLRTLQKKMIALQDTLTAAEIQIQTLRNMQAEREEAYRRSADLVAFYRRKADIAAAFPTVREKVCEWAEMQFADDLVITADARAALRKYDGALDLAILCDGLLYLSAYAKYRRGELDVRELALYAERYAWEVQGCGKEALRMRREDYQITYGGTRCLLDQHIKYGVSAQQLVRVYFCWDNAAQKLVIGYMPGHLATVKKGT